MQEIARPDEPFGRASFLAMTYYCQSGSRRHCEALRSNLFYIHSLLFIVT